MKVHTVFGGPGCGKSSELLRRVDRIRSFGVPAERIAIVSFTKAATEEALSRIKGGDYVISTVHAMCYRKLGLRRPVIVNDSKLVRFFDELGVEYTRESLDLDNVFSGVASEGNYYLSILSLARSMMVDPYDLYDRRGEIGTMAGFNMFVNSYNTWKDSYGFLDFADMLEAAMHAKVPADYDVLIIDEAQDLSNAQWAAIKSMLHHGEVKEVHVALDDDQSLHTWNGANPHGAAEFESEFDADRVVLAKSHRLPRSIHSLAMSTISKAERRVHKNFSCRDDDGVVEYMGWLPDIKPNSLVLARTNMLVLGIERELLERRVPYTKLGSRGTGAWKTPVAEALRVWKKWQSGEKLTDVDEMAVLKACNNYHRSKIEEGALHEVLRGPWQDALVCSDRMMDFYEDVLPYIDSEITVRLGTVHASKGMEADNVYLNAEKTMKVMESAELDPDSEIRVEYVGMTRARHELTIIGENK